MSEYKWLTKESRSFLKRDYLLEGTSPEQRIEDIANLAGKILNRADFAEKFIANMKKGWYSLSTPIWCNFGLSRGMGISCFNCICDDSIESILDTNTEVGIMSKYGGGTSIYYGNVRPRGSDIKNNGKTSGSVHFMKLTEQMVTTISQSNVRRGSCAVYLPIDHGDIDEFLDIKSEGHPIQHLSYGVCIKDDWMQSMIDGDKSKRKIWAKVLKSRKNTGYPYLFFHDNANNNKPQVYKDLNMTIWSLQLCNEVSLPSSLDESFVCNLSSMNILKYDEWKDDPEAVEILVYLLDAVMTEFIDKASKIKHFERAVKFAVRHRAIGVGWLGYHSYLQSKMIPFESMKAKQVNIEIAKNIFTKAKQASQKMAKEYGEPELLKGYGERHTTVCAIAPTKSSSFIAGGVSEGIEPYHSNYYIKDLQKGKFTVKNPYLEQLLEEKGKNTDEVWEDILKNSGSVQKLAFLNREEKNVFKTFSEISPMEIIIQASGRQKYIDQGQSVNLMIHPSIPTKDVNSLLIEAWKLGLKGLYYQISVNAAQEFSKNILSCEMCQS